MNTQDIRKLCDSKRLPETETNTRRFEMELSQEEHKINCQRRRMLGNVLREKEKLLNDYVQINVKTAQAQPIISPIVTPFPRRSTSMRIPPKSKRPLSDDNGYVSNTDTEESFVSKTQSNVKIQKGRRLHRSGSLRMLNQENSLQIEPSETTESNINKVVHTGLTRSNSSRKSLQNLSISGSPRTSDMDIDYQLRRSGSMKYLREENCLKIESLHTEKSNNKDLLGTGLTRSSSLRKPLRKSSVPDSPRQPGNHTGLMITSGLQKNTAGSNETTKPPPQIMRRSGSMILSNKTSHASIGHNFKTLNGLSNYLPRPMTTLKDSLHQPTRQAMSIPIIRLDGCSAVMYPNNASQTERRVLLSTQVSSRVKRVDAILKTLEIVGAHNDPYQPLTSEVLDSVCVNGKRPVTSYTPQTRDT